MDVQVQNITVQVQNDATKPKTNVAGVVYNAAEFLIINVHTISVKPKSVSVNVQLLISIQGCFGFCQGSIHLLQGPFASLHAFLASIHPPVNITWLMVHSKIL